MFFSLRNTTVNHIRGCVVKILYPTLPRFQSKMAIVWDRSIDDIVACCDDPLSPDAVRVGGWLSFLGDTMMCGDEVARSDRGDTGVVVGPGVVQPGWVDASCLSRMLLASAC